MTSASTNEPFVFRQAAAAQVAGAPTAGGLPADGQLAGGQATSEQMIGGPTIGAVPKADPLVTDTRREIAEIVREVATAARSDRTIRQFSSLLVDRVQRAMAAEGVVIWYRDPDDPEALFEPLQRSGAVTDRTISSECKSTHQSMLSEVAREAIPVVVPATPGASEPTIPSNPTDVPVAVVPIESDPTTRRVDYLFEVFLEPEGGVTTQRGYLRFVVQMADLAGEYLRGAELRRLKRTSAIGLRVDKAISHLHCGTRREQVQAAIVDTAAELFDFDRVALCIVDGDHATLASVSHVNKIDQRSDSARYLLSAAAADLDNGISIIADENESSSTIVVAPDDSESLLRLVAIASHEYSRDDTSQLRRFVNHASVSLRNATQFDAIPGGRLLASLAPALQSGQVRWWLRPIFTACVLTIVVILAMLPMPLYVHSPATLRPADVQHVTTPSDAAVQQLHVQHGQVVSLGDALVTLEDLQLEQEITELIGRRGILIEKKSLGNRLLTETASADRESSQKIQNEQRLTEEEIKAVDRDLMQLQQMKDGLVIRADRSGTVDAWRMQERLEGRALSRGDPLMRIVATDTPWMVDVLVPQNRIAHLRNAIEEESLGVQVALESSPHCRWAAKFEAIGPTILQADSGARTSSVLLQLANSKVSDLLRLEASESTGRLSSGDMSDAGASDAPAKAVFYCGRRPAAYVLFQDVISAVRSSAGLYLGTGDK